MAVQGVKFTKVAQLNSLQDKYSTFDTFCLSIQTAAQVEDNHSRSSKPSTILHSARSSDESATFESLFVDRRFGQTPRRRSKKCGDDKKPNGQWNGKTLSCHDCGSKAHLKFHRACPAEISRRKEGGSILDGVRKQISQGHSSQEIFACLAIALDDATCIELS